MNLKSITVTAGLAGLLGACNETDVSKVDEPVMLTKPEGCATVKDIRYEFTTGHSEYQVLCSDKNNQLVLYRRGTISNAWRPVYFKNE